MFAARAVAIAIVAQVIAYCATCGATQAGPDGRAGGTAQLTADQRTASTADPATNGSFGFIAPWRADCATCGTADARTDSRPGRTAHLLTDNIAQHASNTAADSSRSISGGHCSLRNYDAQ